MYCRDELFLRSLECYFGVYFPRCFVTQEINNKITLSWALKQLVTRVRALFSIPVLCMDWHVFVIVTRARQDLGDIGWYDLV